MCQRKDGHKMIFITGDIHADIDIKKLSNNAFKKTKELTRNDYVVILGDFGFPFYDKEIMKKRDKMSEYNFWTRWLSEKPYTILFIDGNHDNFNFWDKQAITEKWGGKVQHHPDIQNAYRLMRGEIYEIDGKKIFTFGGAVSIDRMYRVKDVSYWEHEEATAEEIDYARKNLETHGNAVDYIFTHTMPSKVIKEMRYEPIPDKGAEYFNEVMNTVDYKVWCCGHFHEDKIDEKHKLAMCYNSVVPIDMYEKIVNDSNIDK